MREDFRLLGADRRRQALVGGLLLAVAFVVGLTVGLSTANSAEEAGAEEAEAFSSSFAASEAAAWGPQFAKGLARGVIDGRLTGAGKGREEAKARAELALAPTQGERSESRKDIGYTGGDLGLGGPPLDGDGDVLVVGDSLEVLTGPYLEQYLPRGARLTHNAVGGYNSMQIFDLFKESFDPSHSVVVFDAGTNDNPNYPQILAERLEAVADAVGNRCLVVPTIHGLTVGGTGNAGKNRVVRQFAASRPGTQTPDWAGAVQSNPGMMQPDNLHPTAEGAALRASLIAEGVRACLASG